MHTLLPSLRAHHVADYLRAHHPDAPTRLGVLTNRRAGRSGWMATHPRLLRAVGRPGALVATLHPGELPQALTRLLLVERINVLAVNGGDGTIHALVNALWRWLDDAERRVGHPLPAPRLLFVYGGTMNMAARAMGTRGGAVHTVRWFLRHYEGKPLRAIPTVEVSLLKVHTSNAPGEVYRGFIFGSELVAHALWVYMQFGEGYAGLARLVAHATIGVHLDTALWKRYGSLLDPPESPAIVDGVAHGPYSAAIATTIDMTLARGLVRAARVHPDEGGFLTKILLETDKRALLAMIPALMRDRPHPRVLVVPHAHSLRVTGRFTLDGELYPAGATPDIAAPAIEVEVGQCRRPVLAVHTQAS